MAMEPAEKRRRGRSPRSEAEDWTAELLVGGVLVGVGLLLVWARRGGLGAADGWGELPLTLVLAVAVVVLLGLSMRERERPPAAWRAGLYLFGTLLVPLALLQLLAWVDAEPDVGLNLIWIFALAAAVATAGWARLNFRYSLFVAGVFAAVSWYTLFDQVLDGMSREQARWVLLVAAGILLFLALRLGGERLRGEGGELLSAAGAVFVVATGVLGLGESLLTALFVGGQLGDGAESSLLWDALLLAGSIALVAAGVRGDPRGPAVIGSLGILLFVLVVGAELGAPAAERDGSLLWWPLLVLAAGVALLAYSLEPGLREQRGRREESGGSERQRAGEEAARRPPRPPDHPR